MLDVVENHRLLQALWVNAEFGILFTQLKLAKNKFKDKKIKALYVGS